MRVDTHPREAQCNTEFHATLISVLSCIRVRPKRLLLATPGVVTTVPMLRGVWGAALHDLDPLVWRMVFEGRGSGTQRTPLYVLRPAPPDPDTAPAIEWMGFGAALSHDATLWRAWDVAAKKGLGPKRRGFSIRSSHNLRPDGSATPADDESLDWTLDQAALRVPAPGSCNLVFDAPLRLVRDGRLCTTPTLVDLVLGGLRRLRPLLPDGVQAELREIWRPALQLACRIPSGPWQGARADLVRWSARQGAELELRGVSGVLELPEGAGSLWPLLTALKWLHIGKGTVFGLGQMTIR